MDLEYYAWRRFARAWPLLALAALAFVPGVQEWLIGVAMERGLERAQWLTSVLVDAVLQPVADSVTSGTSRPV